MNEDREHEGESLAIAAIESRGRPNTIQSLAVQLHDLGVREGQTLIVHSSLRALGWTCGGAQAVIMGLLEAVGSSGTIVMPAHSGDFSDPALWENPPVPEAWQQYIRESMPAWRADLSPTRGVGTIPEVFRTMAGVRRSEHPQVSFSACGLQAEFITAGHRLDSDLGEGSPLARLYELDARILMLGTGYDTCTSLHLAEHRADWPGKLSQRQGAPITRDGRRQWVWFDIVDTDTDDFAACGADFEQARPEAYTCGSVGLAECRLVSIRALVDYACTWFAEHRRNTRITQATKTEL
ncbi:MAG: aminoglycoside N(3)-acetyltransferase [Clostridia bacterium]|jgi:aminoglycoside 3-N-acetyltransferase